MAFYQDLLCLVVDTVPVWAKAATARAAKSFIFSKISKLKNDISLQFQNLFEIFKIFRKIFENLLNLFRKFTFLMWLEI